MPKKKATPPTPKRLYRSKKNKVLAGVCGGVAEYFHVDPVWIRIMAVLLLIITGIGFVAYIVMWIVVPVNPNQ